MTRLADDLDTGITEAIKGLRACGYSWAEIGSRLGISRQAAQQRWGALPSGQAQALLSQLSEP